MRAGLIALCLCTLGACVGGPPAATPAPVATPAETPFTLEAGDPEAFVNAFMAARVRGDRRTARLHLSSEAARQFEEGADGLSLVNGFESWELLSLEAIDATSFEVQVRVRGERETLFEEVLFVGSGEDLEGVERKLVVRGATRR